MVVDASLFVAWLLNEQEEESASTFWQSMMKEAAVVPAHWPNEVANALRRAVRTKRLASDDVERVARELSVFDIKPAAPPAADQIGSLAKEALAIDLSVYDLHYVLLAKNLGVPLATRDVAMRRAALRMNVALYAQDQ